MRIQKRIIPSLQLAGLVLILSCRMIVPAAADGADSPETAEVVFLLDASGSMKTQDKDRLALDAIRQGAYSLPSDYQVGLVAYGTEVQVVLPLTVDKLKMDAQLSAVQYGGYTNAGAGLSQAVGLFSDEVGKERYVVMFSDGEIDMPNAEAETLSRESYSQAAAQAKKKGIKICIVAVGSELDNPQLHIFDGAEVTDGAIYWEGQSGSLTQIMERIVSDRIKFPRQSLGVTDAGGGSIFAEIPVGVDKAKLMIICNSGIEQVAADYKAENGHTSVGKRFTIIDMERPQPGTVDIRFVTPDISSVQAYLVTEFTVRPQMNVEYRIEPIPQTEEEIKKHVPPAYEHFADITIEVVDTAETMTNIFADKAFDGVEVPYLLNGVSYTGVLEQGIISQSIPADGIEQVEVSVDISGLGAVYHIEQPAVSLISKIPDPEFSPEPDYRPLWIILGGLTTAIIVLGIWWIRKSRTTVIYVAQPPSSREPQKKMETKSCTYSGKMNMYVVRTENGRDVPPQTYRLFGRKSGRMTLNQILTSCGIKFQKIGAEDIILYPGPEHSLIIMDQSERCTVLRGTEILKKGMGYPVYYNEKITVTFEDEATEMEIHYKNLKPSEREA